MMGRGIFGTVSSVNGTTLTVTGKQGFGSTTTQVSYSVDASSATVTKNNAASTLSAVAVGDTVAIQGTVTGTNVVAKNIRDGVMAPGNKNGKDGKPGENNGNGGEGNGNNGMPAIQGNGQPIVAGNVTSISGNSIVINNKSNVQYTIDATNAKILKGGNSTSTLANISVGDSVVVQGAITGNSVVASSILDGGTPAPVTPGTPPHPQGFLGGIRSFFGRIFGF